MHVGDCRSPEASRYTCFDIAGRLGAIEDPTFAAGTGWVTTTFDEARPGDLNWCLQGVALCRASARASLTPYHQLVIACARS